jgi:hypothetical protein
MLHVATKCVSEIKHISVIAHTEFIDHYMNYDLEHDVHTYTTGYPMPDMLDYDVTQDYSLLVRLASMWADQRAMLRVFEDFVTPEVMHRAEQYGLCWSTDGHVRRYWGNVLAVGTLIDVIEQENITEGVESNTEWLWNNVEYLKGG